MEFYEAKNKLLFKELNLARDELYEFKKIMGFEKICEKYCYHKKYAEYRDKQDVKEEDLIN